MATASEKAPSTLPHSHIIYFGACLDNPLGEPDLIIKFNRPGMNDKRARGLARTIVLIDDAKTYPVSL
jgi:hypothetical protein